VATTADSPPHAVSPWQQLQAAYTNATGRSPVWPQWTSGFWQCKLRYSNQSQIMDVAREYVRRSIPLSLMIIDFFSWNDPVSHANTIGDETLPASCWPDPKLMVTQLKEMGVELMISPYSHSVGTASHNYAEAAAKQFLATDRHGKPAATVGPGATYDLFQPAARAYAWNAMKKGYVDQYGLHHWWLDCVSQQAAAIPSYGSCAYQRNNFSSLVAWVCLGGPQDEPCGGTNNGTYSTDWLYNRGKWPAAFVGSAYPQMLDLMIWEGEAAPGKQYERDNVMLGRAACKQHVTTGRAVPHVHEATVSDMMSAPVRLMHACGWRRCRRGGITEVWWRGVERRYPVDVGRLQPAVPSGFEYGHVWHHLLDDRCVRCFASPCSVPSS
jgi:hypothetical protein